MNWKIIGKYTGFIFLATFIVGFAYGIINTVLKEDMFAIPILTNLVVMVIIFANLAIEQHRRTVAHASVVTLFCWLISILLNVVLFQQLSFEFSFYSLIGYFMISFIGVAVGLVVRPRVVKQSLPVQSAQEIPKEEIKIAADTIVFCLYCRTNNRIRKGTMIGIKPVCGKCGSILEIKKSPPAANVDDFAEYADVDFTEPPSAIKIEAVADGNQTKQNVNQPGVYVGEDLADDMLKVKFYKLLHYDYEQAHRIIESKKRRYPGKSERWYWEKAVDDEIRIRG